MRGLTRVACVPVQVAVPAGVVADGGWRMDGNVAMAEAEAALAQKVAEEEATVAAAAAAAAAADVEAAQAAAAEVAAAEEKAAAEAAAEEKAATEVAAAAASTSHINEIVAGIVANALQAVVCATRA